MLLQPLDLARAFGDIGQVKGPVDAVTKALEIAGQTNIAQIAAREDHPSIRKQHRDMAEAQDIVGMLMTRIADPPIVCH